MKRIVLMILYNLFAMPRFLGKAYYYAKHTDEIDNDKKYKLLKEIVARANKGGRIRTITSGQELLPAEETFMLFPNHQGLYDVLALIHTCPYFFSLVGKIEIKDIPVLKWITTILKAKFMDRSDVRQSMTIINEITEEVKKGTNFLIFPEGTRSKKGNRLLDFKGGSFKAAMKAKCPIVPVALLNCYEPFDSGSIKPVTVQVHYLEPLMYEDYKNLKTVEVAELVKSRIEKCIEKNEKKLLTNR